MEMCFIDPGGVIVSSARNRVVVIFRVCLVSCSLLSWLAVQLWLEAAGLWTRVNTVDWVRAIKSLCHSQFDGSSPSFARCSRC